MLYEVITDAVEHIDFLEIADDKKVTISVPVKLKGLAEGVRQGGKMMLRITSYNVCYTKLLRVVTHQLVYDSAIYPGEAKLTRVGMI